MGCLIQYKRSLVEGKSNYVRSFAVSQTSLFLPFLIWLFLFIIFLLLGGLHSGNVPHLSFFVQVELPTDLEERHRRHRGASRWLCLKQGSLTEEEDSVQLTSLFQQVFIGCFYWIESIIYFRCKTMRRSPVLSLLLKLVFPGRTTFFSFITDDEAKKAKNVCLRQGSPGFSLLIFARKVWGYFCGPMTLFTNKFFIT